MLSVRQRLHREATLIPLNTVQARNAASAQGRGYIRLLQISAEVDRASNPVGNNSRQSHEDTLLAAPSIPLSDRELLICHMADVDAELFRWEQFEWLGEDSMGSVDLVEFWRTHKHQFPLLYWVSMDVLPVQASAESSEQAFSSGKLTR
ncbi:hypothetical protein RSOLAG1IB_11368 [Rhizoctonia solani AG-1 IB]|uniref:HAT C-terminal dimerisation domain-containing protein n=1 Tax=Thanatephorus cucumeris (strain AG1-IB / isolate 7/3/14) TaxID=1108050 RepID=A0A0B7F5T2_THACB|nr:hypothetical protein RSOLAG1IB_11368 [Rhizoctonia solani AG-1 IB]